MKTINFSVILFLISIAASNSMAIEEVELGHAEPYPIETSPFAIFSNRVQYLPTECKMQALEHFVQKDTLEKGMSVSDANDLASYHIKRCSMLHQKNQPAMAAVSQTVSYVSPIAGKAVMVAGIFTAISMYVAFKLWKKTANTTK